MEITITEQQKKRLGKLSKLIMLGDVAVAEHLFELEEKIDELYAKQEEKISNVKSSIDLNIADVIKQIKSTDEETPSDERIVSLIKPLIPDVKNGENYILTSNDKKEIAESIKVPVVRKVIERIETIKELPLVTNITKEVIREVAKSDTAEQLRDKLETLEEDARIDAKFIKNLPSGTKEVIRMGGGNSDLSLKANSASPTFTGTVSGVTASMVGLGNVNNTSDADKPISTAQQTDLDLRVPYTAANTNLDLGGFLLKSASVTTSAINGEDGLDGVEVRILGGDADFGSGSTGGNLTLAGGQLVGQGGVVNLAGGNGVIVNSSGGRVTLIGGEGDGTGVGGDVDIFPGSSPGGNGKIRLHNRVNGIIAILDVSPITTTEKTFTFPNATGTIALTSDLSIYAPIASPTFTGTVVLPASQIVNGVTLSDVADPDYFLAGDGTYKTPAGGGGLSQPQIMARLSIGF